MKHVCPLFIKKAEEKDINTDDQAEFKSTHAPEAVSTTDTADEVITNSNSYFRTAS